MNIEQVCNSISREKFCDAVRQRCQELCIARFSLYTDTLKVYGNFTMEDVCTIDTMKSYKVYNKHGRMVKHFVVILSRKWNLFGIDTSNEVPMFVKFQALRKEPNGYYGRLDFDGRAMYRLMLDQAFNYSTIDIKKVLP